jgi:hypothetical protein
MWLCTERFACLFTSTSSRICFVLRSDGVYCGQLNAVSEECSLLATTLSTRGASRVDKRSSFNCVTLPICCYFKLRFLSAKSKLIHFQSCNSDSLSYTTSFDSSRISDGQVCSLCSKREVNYRMQLQNLNRIKEYTTLIYIYLY